MNKVFLTVLAVICLSTTACNDQLTDPSATPDVGHLLATSDRAVVASVCGNAFTTRDETSVTAVFNVRKFADGTADGWYHALRRGQGGGNIRVRIDCLHVAGNEAWARGYIVDAGNPNNVGRPVSFHVVDNGEGNTALPDQFGAVWSLGDDCITEPDIETRDVTIGNVQVRG